MPWNTRGEEAHHPSGYNFVVDNKIVIVAVEQIHILLALVNSNRFLFTILPAKWCWKYFIDLNNRRLLKRKLEGEVVLYFKIS